MAEQAVRRAAPSLGREIVAVGTFALAVLVTLALVSFDDRDIRPGVGDTHNLIGPVGAWVAHGLYGAFGYASYLLAAASLLAGVFALLRWPHFGWHRTVGGLLFLPTLALLLHLRAASPDDVAGGLLGEALGEGLRGVVHDTGAWIVAIALLALALLLSTPLSLMMLGGALKRGALGAHQWFTVRVARWERRRALAREKRAAKELREAEKLRVANEKAEAKAKAAAAAAAAAASAAPLARFDGPTGDDADTSEIEAQVDRALTRATKRRAATKPKGEPPGADPTMNLDERDVLSSAALAEEPAAALPFEPEPVAGDEPPVSSAATAAPPASPPPLPKIVEPVYREKQVAEAPSARQASLFTMAPDVKEWSLPPLGLLEYDETSQVTFDRDELMRQAERLTKALGDFRIEGRVVEIHPGPVVTMYEFELAAGTKVKQVQSLEDDLALALQAVKVRITAIPGKGVLGIEVANRERETVYLKEIIGSEKFHKMGSKLPMALGKDISGQAVVTDLAKMPHLLVAGTTGSGKSVGMNSMLISIIYASTPEEVRFILVDQKTTEFGPYDGLPHLLLPVVVDPKRAAVALRWAVEEMERRYGLMSELGVRHIIGYNKKIEQMKANGETFPGDEPLDGEEPLPPRPVEKMPYIVVMIDELADLMMVAPREVEGSLQRLAQMARACGIHIIIATQRPSVDVVSGVIRANFPARIAFQTRTRVDSRTILDDGGAEQLLGQGDMLLLPPGTSNLQRVHGAFVSDAEVKAVVDAWKAQGKPNYDPSILTVKTEDGEAAADDEPPDEMYDAAIAIVAETRQVSISMIQRRLRVGYNRAARMVERMERDGIIGPNLGPNQPREVYVSPQG